MKGLKINHLFKGRNEGFRKIDFDPKLITTYLQELDHVWKSLSFSTPLATNAATREGLETLWTPAA